MADSGSRGGGNSNWRGGGRGGGNRGGGGWRGRGGGGGFWRGRGGGGNWRGRGGGNWRGGWKKKNNDQSANDENSQGGGEMRPSYNRNNSYNNNNGSGGGGGGSNRLFNTDNYSQDLSDLDESSNAFIFDATAKDDDIIIATMEDNPDCRFQTYHMYFPKEKFKKDSEIDQFMELFYLLIKRRIREFNINQIIENGYFTVNYKNFFLDDLITESIPNISVDFVERPQFYFNCVGIAMHQFIIDKYNILIEKLAAKQMNRTNSIANESSASSFNLTTEPDESDLSLPTIKNTKSIPMIKVRVLNFRPLTKIKLLKANMYDKLVTIMGTVTRVSVARPFITRLAFECTKCNTTFQVALTEGKFQNPPRCAVKSCNGKLFAPLKKHFMTKVVEWQRMKLQEIILDQKDVESGRIPRTIECEITEDLTGTVSPGDMIAVSGIVKALTAQTTGGGHSNKDKCSFVLYINANSIQLMGSSNKDSAGEEAASNRPDVKNLEFSAKDLECFKDIKNEEDPFRLLVNSLCPSIFGHELVKAGLILGLFGGSKKNSCQVAVRSDPHVLVVGDPGLGKSQLLKACANVSPRGVYVCGNSTTTAGLTVSLSKDGSGDDFALEAGALLCAHNGCCCIDEFDKMGSQQQTLLEVMEQQCISIAKGGIVCNLPCRTTVLAAANPIGGHYDKAKTVTENLKLSGPLLSRFDLLFILLDKPDADLDYKLSSHIISLHANQHSFATNSPKPKPRRVTENTNNTSLHTSKLLTQNTETIALAKKLVITEEEKYGDNKFIPLPAQLLRKYISYTKRYCEPVIGDEAANVLREFYIHLRQTNQRSNGCNPVTMRQLESLMRLTQARAKCEMRTECSGDDAREVIEIMKASMVDYLENELDQLEFRASQGGSQARGKSGAIKQLVFKLQQISDRENKDIFYFNELKEIIVSSQLKLKGGPADVINMLNENGFLLKKGNGKYKLSSAN